MIRGFGVHELHNPKWQMDYTILAGASPRRSRNFNKEVAIARRGRILFLRVDPTSTGVMHNRNGLVCTRCDWKVFKMRP